MQPGEEEKGLLGKLLDKLRALFRKKQAVAVKKESDTKEVKEDEGEVEEEENCDNEEERDKEEEEEEESKKDKWFVKVCGFFWQNLFVRYSNLWFVKVCASSFDKTDLCDIQTSDLWKSVQVLLTKLCVIF